MNYYNEFDPKAAAWLRELIKGGHIAPGDVDERSIVDVKAPDLAGYVQCHFFAGVGGWSLALRLAGVPDDEEIWTGSCPCQPLSCAGLGLCHADERHLWPAFFDLIAQRRPAKVFGEQVASAAGREWFAGVRADLEGVGYACGGADLCSAGVGSPNIRQRLFWVADANQTRRGDQRDSRLSAHTHAPHRHDADGCGESGGLAGDQTRPDQTRPDQTRPDPCWLVQSKRPGLEGLGEHEHDRHEPRWIIADSERSAAEAGPVNFWTRCGLVPCTDGKTRRVEPESFPLAHGVSGRVGLLRGYGNAINPVLAAEFIKASEQALKLP